MTLAVDIYKNGIQLGSGTATAASATVASVTATASRVVGPGRNVQLVVTDVGTNNGRSWNTRVVTDGVTSLTLADACPYT